MNIAIGIFMAITVYGALRITLPTFFPDFSTNIYMGIAAITAIVFSTIPYFAGLFSKKKRG